MGVWFRVQELGFAVFLAHFREAKASIALAKFVAEVSVKASKVTGLAAVGIVNCRLTPCRYFIVIALPLAVALQAVVLGRFVMRFCIRVLGRVSALVLLPVF